MICLRLYSVVYPAVQAHRKQGAIYAHFFTSKHYCFIQKPTTINCCISSSLEVHVRATCFAAQEPIYARDELAIKVTSNVADITRAVDVKCITN